MRVAIIHDTLTQPGGAERMLHVLHEMYPSAPIFTVLFDERKMRRFFPDADIRPSSLSRMKNIVPRAALTAFSPHAVESFDLRGFDLVISSSSLFAKGIITSPNTIHISYCHTPPRFLWDDTHYALRPVRQTQGRQAQGIMPFTRFFALPFFHWLRVWDIHAAQRPDYYIANSRFTAARIKKYYHRDAQTVYPPVSIPNYIPNYPEHIREYSGENSGLIRDKYFLVVSQLRAYKRVDIAVDAFSKLGLPLVVAGEGHDEKRLRKTAGKNIMFLGWVSDEERDRLYRGAQALVFPTKDDFGIVPVEAMAHGKPVLAFRGGGVLETMREGVTGEFFDAQDQEAVADGVRRILEGLRASRYDPEALRQYAQQFSKERFVREFREFVENAITETRISADPRTRTSSVRGRQNADKR